MAQRGDTPPTFGALIRDLRTKRGWTQAQLASRAGITERAVQKLESDATTRAREETIVSLAGALDVSPAQLDAKLLGGDVVRSADTPKKRALISRLLLMDDEELDAVLEIVERTQRLRGRRKK
jgi:transcriptional regulator with XRE-family HTH domain